MIHPSSSPRHPFDSARVEVRDRVRSSHEGRGLPYARDRTAGIVVGSSLHVPPRCLPGCRPSVSCNNGFRTQEPPSPSFLDSTDHLQPHHRITTALCRERQSRYVPRLGSPERSLLSDGIYKGREPFLKDMPLIRITYRTPRAITAEANFRGSSFRDETLLAAVIHSISDYFSWPRNKLFCESNA